MDAAIRKAASGCADCAKSYFALARANGATEDEIRRAAERAGVRGISRRQLVKLAAASAAVLSTTDLLGDRAAASTVWWGTDSAGATCCGIPQDFYIGKFGEGLSQDVNYFNTSAASATGSSHSYEYWVVRDPA